MTGTDIAAVVPAAGYSERMRAVKPLMKLGRATVLERTVESLLLAGVGRVFLVTGSWRNEIMDDFLYRDDVTEVYNPDYDLGMFSSVKAGVSALPDGTRAFFMLPADCAGVSPETVRQMAERFGAEDLLQPVNEGKTGHPILISGRMIPAILEGESNGGLRGVLDRAARKREKMPVGDEGILLDMDERGDYYRMEAYSKDYDRSGEEAAKELLEQSDAPPHVKEHCLFVARLTGIITGALAEKGVKRDRETAVSAALLHDVCRLSERHAAAGRQFAFRHGMVRAGAVIGSHMGDGIRENLIGEKEIVFLADKFAMEDILVSADRRFDRAEHKYRKDGAALANVKRVHRMAQSIRRQLESVIGRPLLKLLQAEVKK